MDQQLLRMAQEERIGYFSLYHAMGGRNSMLQWQQRNLAGNDGIHFTPDGAVKAGRLLAEWLENGRQMVKK
jgi:lysophospholipase L1-like esterase